MFLYLFKSNVKFSYLSKVFFIDEISNYFALNRNRFLQCSGNSEFDFKFKFIFAELL